MLRLIVLCLCAVTAIASFAGAESPAYVRRPAGHGYSRVPYRAGYEAAGTYQRPYPYHLDYYKQRYGGSYEPYFGNLYGPPNVVLGAPYGYYGAPAAYPPAAAPAPSVASPQSVLCPHCHQPLYLVAPTAQDGLPPSN